jgi:hypothetical protein
LGNAREAACTSISTIATRMCSASLAGRANASKIDQI